MKLNVKTVLFAGLVAALGLLSSVTSANPAANQTHHLSINIDGVEVFYREAGDKSAPAILLLHGFGASSHMFRDLIPKLAKKYYVVAPDLPGFGLTTVNPERKFVYNFDNLAVTIQKFTEAKALDKYAMYVFDYGAPVGWRLAVKNPEKITAIITQNGNAYEEGLSPGWADMRKAWADPSIENREALRKLNTLEMTKWQYTQGVKDPALIPPESYFLAQAAVERLGVDIQLDLIMNYGENIKQYAELHKYFKSKQPPVLAIWGKNDPFFLPAGAEAFKRDIPNAEIVLLDTGHFAIETHGDVIAEKMLKFLGQNLK
ncbi:alpha/beta fold hydrolase [Pseudomonas sp. LB1P83]